MGQRDVRRLLINGVMAVVQHASRKGALNGSWLGRMLARKPRMLVTIALANNGAWPLGHDDDKKGLQQSGDGTRLSAGCVGHVEV